MVVSIDTGSIFWPGMAPAKKDNASMSDKASKSAPPGVLHAREEAHLASWSTGRLRMHSW